jgi:hypothetical protein
MLVLGFVTFNFEFWIFEFVIQVTDKLTQHYSCIKRGGIILAGRVPTQLVSNLIITLFKKLCEIFNGFSFENF